jgi:hypothetical protein
MITRLILLHRVLYNGQPNPGDLQALQLAWEHVPYYRHLFTESGIHPRDISGPDDWNLPEYCASLTGSGRSG